LIEILLKASHKLKKIWSKVQLKIWKFINNINKIKTIEVITAGGICVCKSIDEKQIVFRNAIF
jgi:hypothetical protein